MHDFLARFAGNHWRSRFWAGGQQSWTGLVGAGMIWGYRSPVDTKRKITRNGNNFSKSGEPREQEETVAQHVCQNLNEPGLDCKPGSLHETYNKCYRKQPGGLYNRASVYHSVQQELDVVFPPQIHDIFYAAVITTSTP